MVSERSERNHRYDDFKRIRTQRGARIPAPFQGANFSSSVGRWYALRKTRAYRRLISFHAGVPHAIRAPAGYVEMRAPSMVCNSPRSFPPVHIGKNPY